MEDVRKVRVTGLGVEGLGPEIKGYVRWPAKLGGWVGCGCIRRGKGNGLAPGCDQVSRCGFHFVRGVFLMLRGSDGFLQETLKGLLPLGFVSWSFRGGKGSFFIFLINVFHILLLGIGTQGLGQAG